MSKIMKLFTKFFFFIVFDDSVSGLRLCFYKQATLLISTSALLDFCLSPTHRFELFFVRSFSQHWNEMESRKTAFFSLSCCIVLTNYPMICTMDSSYKCQSVCHLKTVFVSFCFAKKKMANKCQTWWLLSQTGIRQQYTSDCWNQV